MASAQELLLWEKTLGGVGFPAAEGVETTGFAEPTQGEAAGDLAARLKVLADEAATCERCELHRGRTKSVFARGTPNTDLVFVGEGPGYDEDRKGEPFVGAAGRLLTKIIQAIKLDRSQVYICNIIKCRPPRNRNPLPDEIKACAPFLYRQLKSIGPLFVCALGKFAAQTLLETDRPISRLRGRFHEVEGLRILPTYHPAYLLRNPDQKRAVWEDMKLLMKEYPYDTPQK